MILRMVLFSRLHPRPCTGVADGGVDPRRWTRDDVSTWLRVHHREMDVDVSRFAMNGRALCIMTPAMFHYRVGSRHGSTLFVDFRRRLLAAVVAQCSFR